MEIIVFSPDPHHISPSETRDLAEKIRSNYLGVRVHAHCKQRTGKGVSLHEVVQISIGAAGWLGREMLKSMAKKLLEIAVHWARQRFDRRNRARTVYICVRGPNGRTVTAVRLKRSAHEPEDATAEAQRLDDSAARGRSANGDVQR